MQTEKMVKRKKLNVLIFESTNGGKKVEEKSEKIRMDNGEKNHYFRSKAQDNGEASFRVNEARKARRRKIILKRGLHQIILQFIFLTESFCRFISLAPRPTIRCTPSRDQIHLTDDGQLAE